MVGIHILIRVGLHLFNSVVAISTVIAYNIIPMTVLFSRLQHYESDYFVIVYVLYCLSLNLFIFCVFNTKKFKKNNFFSRIKTSSKDFWCY